MSVKNVKAAIPTIDVAMVTVEFEKNGKTVELGFDTANKVAVEVQSETTDGVKLIVKDKLRAQKKDSVTVTGNKITLSDNVFMPELVLLLQGGTIIYANNYTKADVEISDATTYYLDTNIGNVVFSGNAEIAGTKKEVSFNEKTGILTIGGAVAEYEVQGYVNDETKIEVECTPTEEIIGYEPPVVGSEDKGETFRLNCYSSQYDEAGNIKNYEKITYPNCTGEPVAMASEDGAFRAPEYTINSAPAKGQAPYKIVYVSKLPVIQ